MSPDPSSVLYPLGSFGEQCELTVQQGFRGLESDSEIHRRSDSGVAWKRRRRGRRVGLRSSAKKKKRRQKKKKGAQQDAAFCVDGVVGLMVAGPLRPLRLRPPSSAPRYQPPIPLLVPQGSTVLPSTKPSLVSALSGPPHQVPARAVSTLERRMPAPEPPPFWATPSITRRVAVGL